MDNVVSNESQYEQTNDDVTSDARLGHFMQQPYGALTVSFATVAITSNIMSLLALAHARSSIPSYFKLLMSLATSDIFTGITLLLYTINNAVNPSTEMGVGSAAYRMRTRCVGEVLYALNNTALNSTCLNLLAMAVEHYIAILRPLHYHLLVNKRRKNIAILLLWIVSFLFGFSEFFVNLYSYSDKHRKVRNYCEHMWIHGDYQEEFLTFGLSLVCLVVMCVIYIKIYVVVRRQQHREQRQQQQVTSQQDLRRNKKALYTTLLVLGSCVICWLPYCLLQFSIVLLVKVRH